jgi:hypothetical protein
VDNFVDMFSKIFTPYEIEYFKDVMNRKNGIFNHNNFKNNAETRWIGLPCEEAFKCWLEANGMDYKWFFEEEEADDYDFNVAGIRIDVKGSGGQQFGLPEHWCYVSEKQFRKITGQYSKVNCLVFARFVIPLNAAQILGVISVKEFAIKAQFRPAGTQQGSIILSTNDYAIQVNELSPLSSLKDYYFKHVNTNTKQILDKSHTTA